MNKIKVNDVFLEGSSLIAQTFSVNNLGDISTRQGGSSNQFSFPLTTLNRETLGFPEDLNTNERTPYTKVNATLYDNNTPVTNGNLKVTSVNNKEIIATFFSDNSGWFTGVKDKTLKDLNLTSLAHTYDGATIRSSLANTSGYIYPLIDYGEFKAEAFDTADIAVEQMFPAVYVSDVFNAIFNDIQFEVDGEMLDTFEFNKMIIPFSDVDFINTQTWVEENTIEYSANGDQGITLTGRIDWDIPSGNSPIFTTGNRNIFEIQCNVILNSLSAGVTAVFTIVKDDGGTTNLGSVVLNNPPTEQTILIDDVFLEASSDTIYVELSLLGDAGATATIDADSYIRLTPKGKIYEGNDILNPASFLPSIKQSDFIKYLCNLLGAFPVTDKINKKVTFHLFKNIKGRLNDAEDWSEKIDIAQARSVDFTELVGEYGSKSIFKYLEDEDDNELNTYKARNGIDFGSGVLSIDNEFIANRKDIYEAPFGGSINVVSFDNAIYIPQIKWLDATGESESEPVPKVLLILTGFDVSELTGGNETTLSIDGTTVSELPFAWFAKASYTPTIDGYTQSISFGDITFTSDVEGTLSRHWSDYSDILSNMKYVKAPFKLNAADIANLDFTRPVYIDKFKSYFYINSVNEFTGSEELTECELIKIA